MKNYIIFFFAIIFLSFVSDKNKSSYTIPVAAYSVIAGDIDMDGDNDIIVGHKFSPQTNWGGWSIVSNADNINLFLLDSMFVNNGFAYINYNFFNDNDYLDFFSTHVTDNPYIAYISVVLDYGINQSENIKTYNVATEPVHYLSSGDINNDGFQDIVFASYDGQLWGILYNDGQANFTEPEFYNVSNYNPKAIKCGNLNNDGKDDIVISGQLTEIYISNASGFEILSIGSSDNSTIVDFDYDGDCDVITYHHFWNITELTFYENLGENEFIINDIYNIQTTTSGFFVSDFNNDNLPDVLFQLYDNSGYLICYNQGDFQLSDTLFIPLPAVSPEEPGSWRNCYLADMDGNEFNDIIVVKTIFIPFANNLEILFNDGNGNFVNNPITSISENTTNQQNETINAYPNPFSNHISIEIKTNMNCHLDLFVYDLKGKLIFVEKNTRVYNDKHIFNWDGIDNQGNYCNAGIYLVKVLKNGEYLESMKIIKSK